MTALPPANRGTPATVPSAGMVVANGTLKRWTRGVLFALLYIAAYLLLEIASDLHAVERTAITAWSPSVAMMVAVVMHFGVRTAPVTILAPWISDIVTRHMDPFGVPALAEILSVGCIFTVAGLLLRRLVPGDRVSTIPGFALLLLIIAISALADAVLYAAALLASGHLSATTFIAAATTNWIGDMNGIVTLLPFLLLLRTGGGLELRNVRAHLGVLLLQFLALAASFLVVFVWAENDQLHLFYLLFVPIIWIALRWGAGVTALTLVVLQAAIVPLLEGYDGPHPAMAIQLLMVVLAATGLFMGIMVSKNARYSRLVKNKDEQLAQLNRQTSITEFNAAIAHELNNPLAALQNYVRAARLQIERPDSEPAAVVATLDRALGEADRATMVLRRLRAFFRSGSVHMEKTDPRGPVSDAMATLQSRFVQEHIACAIDAPHRLPKIEIDKLHLSVVLHNLLSNACDAIRDSGSGHGRILIMIREVEHYMQFEVVDTGPGVPAAEVPLLFHPLRTDKMQGMGLGLAIGRALLEANGGRIWLVKSDRDGARIAFRVPLAGAAHAE